MTTDSLDTYADLTLNRALSMDGSDEMDIQRKLAARLSVIITEQTTFRTWANRFDELFFTTTFTDWGADLWPDDPSATTPGRSHISVNTPAVYVIVPAALQAVEPIENMLATEDSDASRHAANALERLRKAWKQDQKWQLKRHKAATIKGLYGRTASFTYWDRAAKKVCADVTENPRNLWIGYKGDDYVAVEWAAYVTNMDPSAVREKYSVDFTAKMDTSDGKIVPWVVGIGDQMFQEPHPELTFRLAKVEVWDYWYLMPATGRGGQPIKGKLGEPTKMETWNVVIAGNMVVRGPKKYTEYKGRIPYRPLFNSFIPGVPTGRSELHDMEQLIREKMTRITAGAQMIAGATSGDFWQITGENAPAKGAAGVKPKRNEVVSPGPGNRIESIAPYVAQFQLEQHLGRIDREMGVVSGLNDLLLGLAPVQSLNSSKAINALLANYETRLSMSRELFYDWDRDTWLDVLDVWASFDPTVALVLKHGGGYLDIGNPSLSPRDEMETANRASALVAAKLWSLARGMDAVGVDDPEQEQNIIREERTDATLFPADVQVMAQLMGVLKSLGLQEPAGAQGQMAGQAASGQRDLASALGSSLPPGQEGDQYGPQSQVAMPTGAAQAGAPFAQGPQGAMAQPPSVGPSTKLQGMIQNGQTKGRILTSQDLPVGRR